MVERVTSNDEVAGSIPSEGNLFYPLFFVLELEPFRYFFVPILDLSFHIELIVGKTKLLFEANPTTS
jgi:hypothetical protein